MKTLTVGKNDAGQRLDRFLRKTYPSLATSLIQKSIRKKQIKLNGKKAAADARLSEGDIITVYLADCTV
ncbi:MAG: S4 domain-containing protein [Eubacteriales bacterium]